jgi:ParB family chromosome partitioning protein
LLVRPLAGEEADFELVAGERRWRAAQRLGLHEVPVIVRPIADSEALEIALVENLQRENLSPLEEAEAYSRLMEEFGRSQASLAEAVGKRPQSCGEHGASPVTAGAGAPPPRRVRAFCWPRARALLAAADPVALAQEVVRRGLNVRATERLVQRRTETLRPKQRPRDADTVALERELAAVLGLRVTLEAKNAAVRWHFTMRASSSSTGC